MSEDKNQQSSEKFQRFDDLARKLFKVPASEVRELEEREKQAKQREDKTSSES